MSTDWHLVRTLMTSAIDACERVEALGLTEQDRDRLGNVEGNSVSVFDTLTSAWTYPETLRYKIIHQRFQDGNAQPYVTETARILVNVAQVCAELIGSGRPASSEEMCQALVHWYDHHAAPLLERIVENSPPGSR